MSDTFHEQSVKASRKTRRCDWCGELIEIGQPYESYRWRDGSDGGTVLMHPECLQAMGRTSREEGGWIDWDRGGNVRGKSWSEMDAAEKNARSHRARAWAALGRLRDRAGDPAQALANYQRSLQLNRQQPAIAERVAASEREMISSDNPSISTSL